MFLVAVWTVYTTSTITTTTTTYTEFRNYEDQKEKMWGNTWGWWGCCRRCWWLRHWTCWEMGNCLSLNSIILSFSDIFELNWALRCKFSCLTVNKISCKNLYELLKYCWNIDNSHRGYGSYAAPYTAYGVFRYNDRVRTEIWPWFSRLFQKKITSFFQTFQGILWTRHYKIGF